MKKFLKSKGNIGFTLTELVIVVAIIGLIATLAIPSLMGYLDDAKLNTDLSNAAAMSRIIKSISAPGGLNLATVTSTSAIQVIMDNLNTTTIPAVKSNISADFYLSRNDASVTISAVDLGVNYINLNN
jgi:prepilin-type N-terminal cleavage/methylation domain-containing protein